MCSPEIVCSFRAALGALEASLSLQAHPRAMHNHNGTRTRCAKCTGQPCNVPQPSARQKDCMIYVRPTTISSSGRTLPPHACCSDGLPLAHLFRREGRCNFGTRSLTRPYRLLPCPFKCCMLWNGRCLRGRMANGISARCWPCSFDRLSRGRGGLHILRCNHQMTRESYLPRVAMGCRAFGLAAGRLESRSHFWQIAACQLRDDKWPPHGVVRQAGSREFITEGHKNRLSID